MSLLGALLEVFYPPACIACGAVLEAETFFCAECDRGVEPLPRPGCARCSEPIDPPSVECERCRARPPPFDSAFAPFVHEGPVAHAIHLFKYEDQPQLARPLASLLALQLRARPSRDALVSAIPLHAQRYAERRYDQAELLAAELARRLELPSRSTLERVRRTQRQVGLDETAREQNVAGAFQARASLDGARILLVDDVFTTGATARAASRALKDAGAREVHVVTLARAMRG